jgi:5-methyltetrahydropteroyltriglutamate--homocysteine methyltransferase
MPMFETTLAGSLPKPSWLATPNVLWAPWTLTGQPLQEAKEDATALAIRRQEEAGIDIVSDGEQARQHFVHGFLAEIDGVDFGRKVRMGIRNKRYEADCPTVTAPLARRRFVHEKEARVARAATARKLKFTLPGPMTLIDTLADGYYGDRVKMAFAFAELLNQEAKDLEKLGVDVIQFDEPAFNVFMDEVPTWGVEALERAIDGLTCTTAVHICYGYGIDANIKWKETLGESWRQYEETFPALDRSSIQQVSLECRQSHVPPELMKLLRNKTVLVGAIDVASEKVETPEEVAATLKLATRFVDPERIQACTNCGMAPMTLAAAYAKLRALSQGAALARKGL